MNGKTTAASSLKVATLGISFAWCVAAAIPWFDADIANYQDWPTDGSAKTVECVGAWTGTEWATLFGNEGARRVSFEANPDQPLEFTAESTRMASDELTIAFASRFAPGMVPELPPVGAKGALTVVESEGGGGSVYYGLVQEPNGASNIWTALSGATPVSDRDVQVEISLRESNGRRQVRYAVDGVALRASNQEWLGICMAADASVAVLGCYGTGELAAVSGTTEFTPPPLDLTIPAISGATITSITSGGVALEPDANGVYHAVRGSRIDIVFAPADGYFLNTTTMSFPLTASGDLPAEGRPVAVAAEGALAINEIMASNGSTVSTAAGKDGLDWIEIRNDSAVDADLTGWYLFDDPTKKQSKWMRIEGRCIVPAHGCKIVWADKDYTGFTADEAYTRIGLSADGEHAFLATPSGTIVDDVKFGPQIKDVSVGAGHLTHTILSSTANAEYRVNGSWTPVVGPVGMCGAASGFTVVSYAINATINNMDEALSFIARPSSWAARPVTNVCETIAFTDGGGNTAPGFTYGRFPGVSGDNFVVVVTGSVYVPRAGQWTFATGSDDGFSASISRLNRTWTWEYTSARSYAQTYSTFTLPEAGVYDLRLVYYEKSGGATLDLFVAEGVQVADATNMGGFNLLGGLASGVVHAGALGGSIAQDVAGEMLNRSTTLDWRGSFTLDEAPAAGDSFRLRIRYADGFSASINGHSFASVSPAATPRSAVDALTYSYFDIPAQYVTAGTNVLTVTGVNNSVGDPDFLLAPEVVMDLADAELVYFNEPTPGAPNTTRGCVGPTPKVAFSVPHGWKTEPFTVELSCPDDSDAAIYYTTDGTSPTTGSTRYTGPISISTTTCLRAAVPSVDSLMQNDTAATYLFVEDVMAQSATPPANFPADKAVNGQAMRYAMDQTIVASDRARILAGFTNSISTLSIVVDPADLFDPSKGIYVNATSEGRGWERPGLLEQICPTNAANEFSAPMGVRIRGAYSRGSSYPKHSLRFFFRSEYGMSKLKFPLFGDEGADTFDKFDLRSAQNNSWANNDSYSKQFTFIEECFSRDSQRDLGEPYHRSRYYNLFINGVYWGVYQTEERTCGEFGETYFGGSADDYDVVRTSQPGYVTSVVEGTEDDWKNFWDMSVNEGYGSDHPNNYMKARGLNPDGTRNPNYHAYLDPTNVMVHMLTAHYAADKDAPAAGDKANNMAALYHRYDGANVAGGISKTGWIFNRHDAEHSLGVHDTKVTDNRLEYGTEKANAKFKEQQNFNPSELHYKLCENAEYKMAFADLIYRACIRPGGAMTVEKASARFRSRMAELEDAVSCEAARWGGAAGDMTRTTWTSACCTCLTFITNRLDKLIPQYRSKGWYPSIDPPAIVDGLGAALADGDQVACGAKIFLTGGASGTIYYTTDGTDPRREGGAVSASAQVYTGGSPLPEYVEAFPRLSGNWRYFDWGCAPATDGSGRSWTAPDYDVACTAAKPWGTGAGILGFNGTTATETIGTELSKYANHAASGTQVSTYYFRRSFTVPAAAAAATSVQLNVLYDDCYAVYLNGVEIDRLYLDAGATYSSFSIGGSAHKESLVRTVTIPAGLLREGPNTIAVEVHQNQGASSDVYFDLGFSYAVAGSAVGGLEVPDAGLSLKTRTLSAGGEWSALETIELPSGIESPAQVLARGLRVAAVMSSTADDGGDGAEFIVLTNLLGDAELDLSGVRITSAKTGKDPSLDITLADGTAIPANGARVLTKDACWPDDKITNGAVDMMLYAGDASVIQTLHFESSWWDKACDGTGAHFIADDFGTTVTTIEQWRPSFLPCTVGAAGIGAAVAADDRVRIWLNELAQTPEGAAAIAAFEGDADALLRCRLVGVLPETNPQIEVTIPSIGFDANGLLVIDGALTIHGVEGARTVNGTIKAYHAPTLEALSTTTDAIPLGSEFPVKKGATGLTTDSPSRFFRLKVE